MIRPYRPDDLEIIMDIGNRAYRYIYDNLRQNYGNELFSLLYPNEKIKIKGLQVKDFCKKHPEWVYICEEEGHIAGFITFILGESSMFGIIGDNAVDPECGLKGIGQQMYKAVFDYFRQQGMLYARVCTDMNNIPARRAYERAGFNIKCEQVIYYKKLES